MSDRQIEVVRSLRNPPHGYDEIREYSVDRIERYGRSGEYLPELMVTRTYSRTGLSLAYHECFICRPPRRHQNHQPQFLLSTNG